LVEVGTVGTVEVGTVKANPAVEVVEVRCGAAAALNIKDRKMLTKP
jgi:hypothetical protein